MLGGAPFRGTILLGHLHIDHTQGLPFFRAGDRDDAEVHVIMPEQGTEPFELLSRCYSPPHFPVTLAAMLGRWTFGTIDAGRHRIEGFDVVAADVAHPGGRTMGYRIGDGSSSVVYVSDHGPDESAGAFDAVVELASGADVLIHDSHFTDAEQAVLAEWGHATPGVALEIAERAGVAQLVLFHHAPGRLDADVEAMAASLSPSTVDVIVGREGLTLTLGD